MAARVIVLAGPSGAGKSRLAARLGLPVLRLDDFYRSGSDPALPRIQGGANAGQVDWDDPRSWLADEALHAIEQLHANGHAEVPVYDIAHDGRTGVHTLDLGGQRLFVAEGIFAQEIVADARARGLLDSAWCVRQHASVTFSRRLVRDLREHRKPPLFLLRRGLDLARGQRRVVDHAVALGCTPATGEEALTAIRARVAATRGLTTGTPGWPLPDGLRQPDGTTCGPTALVVARMLLSPSYAAGLVEPETFSAAVIATHRRTSRAGGTATGVQLPWPRLLGTAPWAMAAELSTLSPSTAYRARPVRIGRRAPFAAAVAAAREGRPVAVYVGSPALPRHVVLLTGATDDLVTVFDPADGRRHALPADDVAAGRLPRLSGWSVPWFVVAPRTPAGRG